MFDTWLETDVFWSKIQSRYMSTWTELGPYGAELYLYTTMTQYITKLLPDSPEAENGLDSYHDIPEDILQVQDILHGFLPFFSDGDTISVPDQWCSPKLHALVDVLIENYSPTFQGIVFVEQRQMAVCLARILPAIPTLRGLIRCADLVGRNSPTGLADGADTRNNQTEIVQAFRDGSFNLRENDIFNCACVHHKRHSQ